MTVLGSAAAVYVGGVPASAVYAGTVKVWPAGPPPLAVDGRASWQVMPDGSTRFTVDHPDGMVRGPYAILVDPAPPVFHTQFVLGQAAASGTSATFWGGSPVPVKFAPDRTMTAGDALNAWAGRVMLFTFDAQRRILAVDDVVPATWVTQFGRLKLTVSTVFPSAGHGAIVRVPAAPDPVQNPGNVLGTASPPPTGTGTTYWGSSGTLVGFTDPALQHITNAEAVAAWAGNLVLFRFATASDVDTVTVLGPAA